MQPPILLWHAGDVVLAITVLVLLRRGLARSYRAWWVFLLLQLLRGVVLAWIPFNTLLYARLFMASEILQDLVLALVIYEWFRLLTGHYLGIKLAGTWLLNIGLGISLLICLATVRPEWQAIDWTAPQLYVVLFTKHVIVGILGIFTVIVFLAFYAYRVRVRPNVIWHGLLLTVYLWLQSILAIVDGRSHLNTLHVTNSVRQAAVALLYTAWAVLLTRRGEEVEIAARLTDDERVQLDRLNDELLALARRTVRQV